jgi:hypothetical protein
MLKRLLLGRATLLHRASLTLGLCSTFALLGVASYQVCPHVSADSALALVLLGRE